METSIAFWVYSAFVVIVGCLVVVHYRLYRYFRTMSSAVERARDRPPGAEPDAHSDDGLNLPETGSTAQAGDGAVGQEPRWVFDPGLVSRVEQGAVPGLEHLENALSQDPHRTELVEILAFIYYCRKDLSRAVDAFRRALDLDPDNAISHYYLANAYYLRREPENAIHHWSMVTQLEPESLQAQRARERIERVRESGRRPRAAA